MSDKLTGLYDDICKDAKTQFEVFQRGFSTAASSMRERAINAVRSVANKESSTVDINKVINAIGSLSDISE